MRTRNVPRHGRLGEPRGNNLLNQVMGVETHVIDVDGDIWTDAAAGSRVADAIARRKTERAAQGHRVMPAAKLSLGHPVMIRSISIDRYDEDSWNNPGRLIARTKAVRQTRGEPVPDDAPCAPSWTSTNASSARTLPAGSHVAFLHTGDTGNLSEIPEVVGAIGA